MNQVEQRIKDLTAKIEQVKTEIADKLALVETLRQSNAKLVEQNLGRQRKTASLTTQRNKILDVEGQVEELKYVQSSMEDKLEEAQGELREIQLRDRIKEFQRAEVYHLSQLKEVQHLFSEFVEAITKIEAFQGNGHALHQLIRLASEVGSEKLKKSGIDLKAILTRFKQSNLFLSFDFSRIERINISQQNLINELEAIDQGRRSYYKAQPQTGPTRQVLPIVNPAVEARRLEESRKKSEQSDLSRLLKPKKKIVTHTNR